MQHFEKAIQNEKSWKRNFYLYEEHFKSIIFEYADIILLCDLSSQVFALAMSNQDPLRTTPFKRVHAFTRIQFVLSKFCSSGGELNCLLLFLWVYSLFQEKDLWFKYFCFQDIVQPNFECEYISISLIFLN